VRDRLLGTRAALDESGLKLPDVHLLHGPWSENWGYQAAGQVQALGVSAVFCGNDQIARGLIDGLRERGVAVPNDLAVVGFDNWEVIAAATRPPLTTIDMNLHELGRQAGLRLLGMVNGTLAPPPEQVYLPCRLVVRASCGAGNGEVMAAH
jgi:LacI family transcriptional regulator